MILASKIVLVGDEAVGKTSLRNKFFGKGFNSSYIPTIGADVSVLTHEIEYQGESTFLKLSIWDLAGQESWFSRVLPRFYLGAHAIILVFDVTNKKSFKNAINWITGMTAHININSMPIILIANKIDLTREITQEEGKKLSKEISDIFFKNGRVVPYIETSALTGENVTSIINTLSGLLVKFHLEFV